MSLRLISVTMAASKLTNHWLSTEERNANEKEVGEDASTSRSEMVPKSSKSDVGTPLLERKLHKIGSASTGSKNPKKGELESGGDSKHAKVNETNDMLAAKQLQEELHQSTEMQGTRSQTGVGRGIEKGKDVCTRTKEDSAEVERQATRDIRAISIADNDPEPPADTEKAPAVKRKRVENLPATGERSPKKRRADPGAITTEAGEPGIRWTGPEIRRKCSSAERKEYLARLQEAKTERPGHGDRAASYTVSENGSYDDESRDSVETTFPYVDGGSQSRSSSVSFARRRTSVDQRNDPSSNYGLPAKQRSAAHKRVPGLV